MTLKNLKAEMARYDISNERIANHLGVSKDTVSLWLNANTSPDVNKAFAIRDKFFPGYTIEYLFKAF